MALSRALKKRIAERFAERARFDVPMADYTSFRVGGPADALVMPADTGELAGLIHMLEDAGVPWMVLGGGTNLLVRDRGIRGVVISLRQGFAEIDLRESGSDTVIVHAGAGARLSALCRYAATHHLDGMQFAVGIPGAVGGAIIMNAGTDRGAVESVLTEMDVLHVPDRFETILSRDLTFAYRELVWGSDMYSPGGHGPVVLGGRFRLRQAGDRDPASELEELQARRWQTQPKGLSAGCVFKNPPAGQSAGELIDRAGFKGFRIGDAQVSEVHANFIINRNKAQAAEILRLMTMIRERVYRQTGINLEPEVRIVGE